MEVLREGNDEVDVRIADCFNVDGLRLVVDFFFKIGKIVRVDEVRLDVFPK